MSGLILKLSPKERILINGAVIENGDRRTRLAIKTPDANILRLRDAIHPEDAKTPVRRLCYSVQLVLSGDADPDPALLEIEKGIDDLRAVFRDGNSQKILEQADEYARNGDYYRCLKSLRSLMAREDLILGVRS